MQPVSPRIVELLNERATLGEPQAVDEVRIGAGG